MGKRGSIRERFRPLRRLSFWRDLWRVALEEEILGTAAQLSFYVTFALFPALLALLLLVGMLEMGAIEAALLRLLEAILPGETIPLVVGNVSEMAKHPGEELAGLAIAACLWTALRAVGTVGRLLNRAAGIGEDRGRLMRMAQQLLAVCLTGALIIGGAAVAALLTGQMERLGSIERLLLWLPGRTLMLLLIYSLAVSVLYTLAPAGPVVWRWVAPGPVLAALFWVLAGAGLRRATSGLINYHILYGSVGAMILLLFWIYLTSLSVLVGGHLEARSHDYLSAGRASPNKR